MDTLATAKATETIAPPLLTLSETTAHAHDHNVTVPVNFRAATAKDSVLLVAREASEADKVATVPPRALVATEPRPVLATEPRVLASVDQLATVDRLAPDPATANAHNTATEVVSEELL